VPVIDAIDGIRIKIYNRDHKPAHIHAIYNEYEALIAVADSRIIAGYLPDNQLRKVIGWLSDNRVQAQRMFNELNPARR